MLEEEIKCRLLIAQNEKRYLSKVFLNKESQNPKMFAPTKRFVPANSSPSHVIARAVLFSFLFAARIFLEVCGFTLFAVCEEIFVCCL